MRRRKHCRKDLEARVQLGDRLRAMYRSLGLDREAAANFLQVSSRTLHNWESGKHVIPFAVYKLLRLLNRMELPGPSWAGWSFSNDQLWTPEGFPLKGTDGAWWTLLVRRAVMFDQLYAENVWLRLEMAGRCATGQAGMPQAPSLAERAAASPGTGRRAAPA